MKTQTITIPFGPISVDSYKFAIEKGLIKSFKIIHSEPINVTNGTPIPVDVRTKMNEIKEKVEKILSDTGSLKLKDLIDLENQFKKLVKPYSCSNEELNKSYLKVYENAYIEIEAVEGFNVEWL